MGGVRMATGPGDRRGHAHVLGSRLRQLREGLGMVLQDVANLFGTTRSVPSQWECGQREPAYENLLKLADFYGVTTDWLLGREGADRDSPRVRQVKRLLRDFLRLKEATLRETTPGERLRQAVEFLSEQDPAMFGLTRIARHLLISEEVLRQMLLGQLMATGLVIQRFSQFANLPELWFYQPVPQLEDPMVKYRALVERFQAEALPPDEVEQRIWGGKRGSRRGRKPGADGET